MAKNNKPTEKPVSFYIQGIQEGRIKPLSLSPEIIEEIVRTLNMEGSSTSQIAQFLDKTDRTIRRYLVDIRKDNAVTPNVELAKEMVGDMVRKASISHSYLMRLARSKNGSIAEKTQAEFCAWRVIKELIEKLQTLGYMPLKPQEIVSDVFHHNEGGDTKTYAQLKEEIFNIEKVTKETGTLDPKIQESIKLLQQRIEKAEIAEEVVNLAQDKDHENKK